MKAKKPPIVSAGLSHSQEEYFQKKLSTASKVASYLHIGKQLEKKCDFDGAIKNYKQALSGYGGVARICIANAYEKKRDYKSALEWMTVARDRCPEWSKKPDIERIKYLKYVVKGEYNLAVEHARKALQEYMTLHSDMPVQKQEYMDRLNDLIATKEHILSLKKE